MYRAFISHCGHLGSRFLSGSRLHRPWGGSNEHLGSDSSLGWFHRSEGTVVRCWCDGKSELDALLILQEMSSRFWSMLSRWTSYFVETKLPRNSNDLSNEMSVKVSVKRKLGGSSYQPEIDQVKSYNPRRCLRGALRLLGSYPGHDTRLPACKSYSIVGLAPSPVHCSGVGGGPRLFFAITFWIVLGCACTKPVPV